MKLEGLVVTVPMIVTQAKSLEVSAVLFLTFILYYQVIAQMDVNDDIKITI